jgi:hypothetical protein
MAAKPEPNVTVPAGDAAKGAKVSQSFRILLSRAVLPSYVPLDLQGQVLPVPSDRHHRQGSSRPQPPRPDWPPVRSGCRLCLLRRQQELGHHMVRNAAPQFCRVKQSLLGHPSPPTLPPLTPHALFEGPRSTCSSTCSTPRPTSQAPRWCSQVFPSVPFVYVWFYLWPPLPITSMQRSG